LVQRGAKPTKVRSLARLETFKTGRRGFEKGVHKKKKMERCRLQPDATQIKLPFVPGDCDEDTKD